jgi:O-antigen chain-terminating methyltransferase
LKEPAKITNPEYTVDRIVARMKEAAAHKGHFADLASSDLVTSAEFRPARQKTGPLAGIDIQPIALQPAFQPRNDGRYHVNELLKYHDRSFIQNAYRAILKRGPDATGYGAFIESLRSAQLNKIDILARLRYSAEGRAKKVEIEGLLAPAIIRKAYRVPLIGYLLNLAVAIARLPVMIRSEQQFEAHVLAQQELIAEHLNSIGRTLGAHAREVSLVFNGQFESIKQRDEQVQQQLDLLTHQQQAARDEILNLLTEQRNNIEARLKDEAGQWRQELWALGERVGEATEESKSLTTQLRQVGTEFRQASAEQREQIERLSGNLRREIDRVLQKQQQVSTELVLQGQRSERLLAEARRRLPAPFDQKQLEAIVSETDHTLDAFYASFDEQFRGTREEIKERLKVYLPLIRQQGIGSAEMPILDVGCGRGEWLELLKEQQLRGVGVDSNRVLVGQCAERGLEVVEEDLISYLNHLKDASFGAVTGFHIVEHLPIETLVQFLNEAVRVLKPGGAVIFETPNPQNVLVGSCNFYFDPTHRNPLPNQVMRFLLESRGFVRVEVLTLNPSDDTPVEGDSELARRFNQYFYGPMDYAVIGYRSQTMDDGR